MTNWLRHKRSNEQTAITEAPLIFSADRLYPKSGEANRLTWAPSQPL